MASAAARDSFSGEEDSIRRRPELNIDTSPSTITSKRRRAQSRTGTGTKTKTKTGTSHQAGEPVQVPLTPPNRRNKPAPPPPSVPRTSKSIASRALRVSTSPAAVGGYGYDSPDFAASVPAPADDMTGSNKENDLPRSSPPVTGGAASRPRDSHDLSLPARNVTRDSLMANMLMSLDQFSAAPSPAQNPAADDSSQGYSYDSEFDGLARAIARQDWRNGHGYSYSSDFDAPDDSSRYSSQASRGRRSNSSSNFQSNLGRINSLREPSMRSTSGAPRVMHSRGTGKGSKSSSTNSIDTGHIHTLNSQKRAQNGGNRSMSLDHTQRPHIPQSLTHPPSAHTAWQLELSEPFLDESLDAAPTPTIPSGPRRLPSLQSQSQSPSTAATNSSFTHPPLPPEPEERANTLDRRRSSYMSKSAPASRAGSSGRSNSNHNSKSSNAAPDKMSQPEASPFDADSAPAPSIGYGKSKEPVHAGSSQSQTQTTSQATKERPGFFRRVFGSSKNQHSGISSHDIRNQTAAAASSPATATSSADVKQGGRTQSSGGQTSKGTTASPSRNTTTAAQPPTLQKKPSSFFRRRKKSVVEEAPAVPSASEQPPPMPPIAPQYQMPVDKEKLGTKPEPSPVSSLRKVMTPYLNGPGAITPNTPQPLQGNFKELEAPRDDPLDARQETPIKDEEARQYQRSFSPDYEPSPNARIREVTPEPADQSTSHSDTERHMSTPTRAPPPRPTEKRNDSFLNLEGSDDGEGENGTRRARNDKNQLSNLSNETSVEQATETDKTVKRRSTLVLPMEGTTSAVSMASGSTGTDYKSAVDTPTVQVEDISESPLDKAVASQDLLDEPDFVLGDPTDDERQKAQKIFEGNEDFIPKDKAASWMGEEGPIRQRTLQAYMELYDLTNRSIVQALRQVCERLVFRAETQQVDRILVAFSKRWCECNPNHGFKASDVIHTICYSIMLLNTDLHLADIEHKMTRSQFVKNTMGTVTQTVAETAPHSFNRRSILPDKAEMLANEDFRPSVDSRSNRFSFRPPPRRDAGVDGEDGDAEGCGPLVKAPFDGSMRQWEGQVEIVLKDIYSSIRDERLPLFGAEPTKNLASASQSSLSVMGMLRRSPSVLSKAPSEGQASSLRGRIADSTRTGGSRFASKSRSRPRLGTAGFSSSRTSLDDNNSVWSPAASSATWSKYSLGRTQTSMSMDSFGGSMRGKDYQQSIGFANALSQAIIRDDSSSFGPVGSVMSNECSAQLLDDDSLELAGPPWVKEGMVTHKHHLDGVDKKAKDRNWTEVFAVVQKGQMSLFSFTANKSQGRKNKSARNAPNKGAGPVLVGGGNWQDNATNLGTFSLRQTLASALPAPGYSRSRPHVWALSLPTGAVHLFQVGTADIVKEFVTTANYWSARLSTHPLVGGVSNMEYGWSDACINNALVTAINETTGSQPYSGARPSRPSTSSISNTNPVTSHHGRPSMSSIRSFRSASLDQGSVPFTSASRGGKLPGDRIHITNWSPPTQSLRPSTLPEPEQLATLQAYVTGIEEELTAHNKLRSPMLLAFTPRGTNANKAMANWERKSSYLLREIVKFNTYVDCLQHAEKRRAEVYTEKDLARRAARGELNDEEVEAGGEAEGDVTLKA